MKTLKKYLREAENNKQAIPHFNAANSDMIQAIFQAAQELSEEHGEKIPLVIGVSEGERDVIGVSQFVDFVISLRNQYDYPVFTNADHTLSVERTCEAIDAGFDMVIYDGNKVSHEENLENTKKVVAYKNEVNPHCLVEAEFGYVGSGSGLKDEVPEGISEETMTKPDEAKNFVKETKVDVLAPAVGNVHGIVKSGNPALNPQRVKEILEATNTPLVLHGGSGSSDEDFRAVIDAGISLIHISTELRVAYKTALKKSINEIDSVAPYRYGKEAFEAVKETAKKRMKLFWNIK